MEPFEDVPGRLFPLFVRGVLASTDQECDGVHPEERRAVTGAAPRRQREFLCGRACAHAALGAIGRDRGPLGVGAGRQPQWPAGVVGSISHAGDWSGAVVALAEEAWGLGFDVEVLDPPLTPDVERLVQTLDERSSGPVDHPLARYRSKIAYSAKESVYKCLFPHTGWRLAFDDVTTEIDLHAHRVTARVAPRFRLAEADLASLDVGLVVSHGYVFTGVCIPAPAARAGPLTG